MVESQSAVELLRHGVPGIIERQLYELLVHDLAWRAGTDDGTSVLPGHMR